MPSGAHEQKTLLCRFLEKVIVDDVTECWNWNGAKQYYGYGAFSINRGIGEDLRDQALPGWQTIYLHRLGSYF